MAIQKVLGKVLENIKPDKQESKKALSTVKSFLKALNDNLKSKKISAKAVLGGSFAKDVWLSGDYDVDIFVKFSMKHKDDDLSDLLEKALKPSNPERVHGSRDYFWVKKNNIKFEIVPVLAISRSEQAQNVTDFSPLHVAWANEHGAGLKDDIRLLKQFCKANGVYGAESFINGFSGHVVDILVIHFNGFLNFLKAASTWKTSKKIIVDHYNKYKGKTLLFLNKSKTEGPLVVIDPVQPERNAAAALSLEKLNVFLKAAKAFLKKPSIDFFTVKSVDIDDLKSKDYLVLRAKPVKARDDVAGCKLLQIFDFLKYEFDKEEFVVEDCGWFWDKEDPAIFWFKLKNKKLPEMAEHKGPPLSLKDAVKAFKAKYAKTFTKNKNIWAKIKRKHLTPEALLKDLLKSEHIKEKTVNIKLL